MNGPEHYSEAEKLLLRQNEIPSNFDDSNPAAALLLAEAQVHATLALAAATALAAPSDEMPRADTCAWCEVAGVSASKVAARG